ncbi:hypothetical protein [Agromyces salentinus]|uniref:Uncharacterized protein n=1 Tax=Agromyces salentinus TaxID=269421 RepID=A0ABN2MPF1_9MICO|nr:hypothetical protein [Agromyces salentinus]
MSLIDLAQVVGGVAFLATMVVASAAATRVLGLEQRAGLLERRDPGRAEALRRADAMGSISQVGGFGFDGMSAVCTPSRSSWLDMARVRASGSDLRVEPPEEALPPMPTTVLALAQGEHVARGVRPRHPSPEPRGVPHEPQVAGTAKNAGHQATASG